MSRRPIIDRRPPEGRAATEERLAVIISTLLRVGVVASVALVLAGGIAYLAASGTDIPHYEQFRGQPATLSGVCGVVARAVRLDPLALIQTGLLLLILTPVARVVLSIVAFALERDRLYLVISAIVLAVLVFSLAGARV